MSESTADLQAAMLELERQKGQSENLWRKRTYGFTIASALLTAAISISVALIARPSASKPSIDVAAVRACRDSVDRLSDSTQQVSATKDTLSQAIGRHAAICGPVLDDVIGAVAGSVTR